MAIYESCADNFDRRRGGPQSRAAGASGALGSGRPELIAIYGGRRVGKTYLVWTFYAEQLCFELTGIRDATRAQQLAMFARAMEPHVGQRIATPPDWPSAFQALARLLESQRWDGARKVIFFDELPWLASRRSGFLAALDHFWNSWAQTIDGDVAQHGVEPRRLGCNGIGKKKHSSPRPTSNEITGCRRQRQSTMVSWAASSADAKS